MTGRRRRTDILCERERKRETEDAKAIKPGRNIHI